MGMHYAYSPKEAKLELAVDGNLDLTMTPGLMEAIKLVDSRLQTCVIDTNGVSREFDSGVALMAVLLERLQRYNVALILRGHLTGSRLGNAMPSSASERPA